MINDVMVHFDQPLSELQHKALQQQLAEHFGIPALSHHSEKPSLYFFATEPSKAPPREVMRQIAQAGYNARLVGL